MNFSPITYWNTFLCPFSFSSLSGTSIIYILDLSILLQRSVNLCTSIKSLCLSLDNFCWSSSELTNFFFFHLPCTLKHTHWILILGFFFFQFLHFHWILVYSFYLSASIFFIFIPSEHIFFYLLEHSYNNFFKILICWFHHLSHLRSPLIIFSL